MVTTAERGREVRQRLLAAATELIAERGWTAVSTRVLAERAGVAPGIVHYHFSSMQALLVEAAVAAARALAGEVGPRLAAADSAEAMLGELFGLLEPYTGTDPLSLLLVEAYLAATRDEGLRAGLGAVIGALRRELAGFLGTHGVPDPDTTALVLAAAIDGVLLHRALLPGPSGAEVATVLRRLVPAATEGPR
jgi:AcrR family transcriptional regulator